MFNLDEFFSQDMVKVRDVPDLKIEGEVFSA